MAEAEAAIIREGFLCPICHKDLRSPNNLIAHFQDLHGEEQDILKSIKDLYGKAKKIFKLDEHDLEVFKNEIQQSEKYCLDYYTEPQDPGQVRSHTDYFRSMRRERLDHRTAETNKLIIRLDRLLRFYGADRKQQEQELVAWLDGSTVTRCPSCASSFNLTRRQHHCRLCGSVMCKSCSYFLSYETAQAIVAPVHTVDASGSERGAGPENKENDTIRICSHCLDMLECRRRVQIEQMMQPIICQLYSHLQKLKQQTQNSVDLYLKMYDSLTSGESTFQLQDTQSLRSTIARQAETIDTLSKKIATLPLDALDESTASKVAHLQSSIRLATSHYIKEYLVTLPVPPNARELERIRAQRSLKSLKEEEEQHMLIGGVRGSMNLGSIKKVTVATGWSPAHVTVSTHSNKISSSSSSGGGGGIGGVVGYGSNSDTTDSPQKSSAAISSEEQQQKQQEEDPLVEQMNIVRNYIEQARRAQRFEEAASLQENLKMLKETYRQQQRQKQKEQ